MGVKFNISIIFGNLTATISHLLAHSYVKGIGCITNPLVGIVSIVHFAIIWRTIFCILCVLKASSNAGPIYVYIFAVLFVKLNFHD